MEKFGKVIKYTCLVVLVILFAAVITRIVIMTDKSKLSKVTPNPALAVAYNDNENINFVYHNVYDEISKQGFFAAYGLIYVKDVGQMQFTIRYNDSIYSYNDFEKDSEFRYYLYNSKTGELKKPSVIEADEKLMYNYRRFVFDGVSAGEGEDYYIYIYYGSEKENPTIEESFDNLPIHYSSQEWKDYKLSNAEKESLKNYN